MHAIVEDPSFSLVPSSDFFESWILVDWREDKESETDLIERNLKRVFSFLFTLFTPPLVGRSQAFKTLINRTKWCIY